MTKVEGLDRVKDAVGDTKTVSETKARYMRPGECRSHMRRTLAKEFQGIVDGFVEAAKKGSCPHVKLATELLKPTHKKPSRKKGSVALLLEKFEQQDREKERLQKERLETK